MNTRHDRDTWCNEALVLNYHGTTLIATLLTPAFRRTGRNDSKTRTDPSVGADSDLTVIHKQAILGYVHVDPYTDVVTIVTVERRLNGTTKAYTMHH